MSCNYYRGNCLFLNGKEDGCKGCPIKKAYNKGVRDTKKDGRPQGECKCLSCKYRECDITEKPCRECSRSWVDHYEAADMKGGAE